MVLKLGLNLIRIYFEISYSFKEKLEHTDTEHDIVRQGGIKRFFQIYGYLRGRSRRVKYETFILNNISQI